MNKIILIHFSGMLNSTTIEILQQNFKSCQLLLIDWYLCSCTLHPYFPILSMIVANDNTTMGPPLDITPASMKKKRGSCVKGCLSYSNSQVETLLDLMEQYLPVGTQEWEYIANEYSSAHPRPLHDVASLRHKFNTLAKKKNTIGNPPCPPFVRWAKKSSMHSLINVVLLPMALLLLRSSLPCLIPNLMTMMM